jgi:hypothetical protein
MEELDKKRVDRVVKMVASSTVKAVIFALQPNDFIK